MLCLPREERASCAAPTTRCLSYAPCSALRTGEAESIHHSGTAWRSFPVTAPGTTKGGGVEEKKIIQDRIPHPRHSSIGNRPACLSEKGQKKQRKPKSQGQRTAESRAFAPNSPISRLHASTPSRLYPTRTRTPSRSHRTPPIPILSRSISQHQHQPIQPAKRALRICPLTHKTRICILRKVKTRTLPVAIHPNTHDRPPKSGS